MLNTVGVPALSVARRTTVSLTLIASRTLILSQYKSPVGQTSVVCAWTYPAEQVAIKTPRENVQTHLRKSGPKSPTDLDVTVLFIIMVISPFLQLLALHFSCVETLLRERRIYQNGGFLPIIILVLPKWSGKSHCR